MEATAPAMIIAEYFITSSFDLYGFFQSKRGWVLSNYETDNVETIECKYAVQRKSLQSKDCERAEYTGTELSSHAKALIIDGRETCFDLHISTRGEECRARANGAKKEIISYCCRTGRGMG